MAPREDVNTKKIAPERVVEMIENLRKFEYASRDHALLELMWHGGMRTGAVRGIDLEDYDPDRRIVHLHHRPDTGTPLKNGREGERIISIKPEVNVILRDYVETKRKEKTDDYGREPLFTTKFGRISKQALRVITYRWTQPCQFGGECPHGREPSECEAATAKDKVSTCPSGVSPHPIRKASITYGMLKGARIEEVSGRMDVSPDILKRHYDQRTLEEQMEQRRGTFDNI
jgi:integrase